MTKIAITLNAAIVILVCSMSAAAETWRWVDTEGVVNYSERKPRGVDAELVGEAIKPGTRTRDTESAAPAPPPSIPGATQSQPELSQRQQQMLAELESTEANRQAQLAKVRQENCATAQRVLENLTTRDRVRVRMENGTTRVLGEEERQERIAEAQRGVVTNCES